MSDNGKMESFIKAFSPHVGSCHAMCQCGREFYNSDNGWDFDEGELERLSADPKATDLDWSISYVDFEGSIYISDCDCWRYRAVKIIEFLEYHADQIAEYLTLEKQRKQKAADDSPVVEP